MKTFSRDFLNISSSVRSIIALPCGFIAISFTGAGLLYVLHWNGKRKFKAIQSSE